MKHLILFLVLIQTSLSAQSATETARAALSAAQWTLTQAAMIEQRDALNAAHIAELAALVAANKAAVDTLNQQLDAQSAAKAKAETDLTALNTRIAETLNAKLSSLQAAYAAEIKTGEGPKSQALQAQIALLESLQEAAGKSPVQVALDAARAASEKADADFKAAKAAADAAARAALNAAP